MSGGRLQKLTQTRQHYTGEAFADAKRALRGGDNRQPLSGPVRAQARLEAETFDKLCNGGEWWAHPLGLASTQATATSAIVQLDDYTMLGETKYARSALALDCLLPYAEPGVQVHGIVGLRVVGVEGADLHLTLVGGGCRLVLRGITERRSGETKWSKVLDERQRRCEKAGLPPLWQEAGITAHEDAHMRDAPLSWRAERDLDWLGSALLRRIAVFHTFSSAYSTRSWITGDDRIFELDTVRGVRLGHDDFLQRLTDPVWGLPLLVERQHCSCDPSRELGDNTYTLQCTYRLSHRDGVAGGLQLRFRHGPGVYSDGTRTTLERLGADSKWLDRVLPSSSPDVDPGRSGARRSHPSSQGGLR